MSARNHVVITGTGRTGTTFLVEILTHLGLDTGFSIDTIAQKKHREARAGLEHDIRDDRCPFVVKNPRFCDYVGEVIQRDDIIIEHIFIPFRDLQAAAESRRQVKKANVSKLSFRARLKQISQPSRFAGGLWHTQSDKAGEQEKVLLGQVYKLMLALSDTSIPITLMRYPRLARDSGYLLDKLKPILPDTDPETFRTAFDKVSRPDLVHSFSKNDR